MTKSATLTIPVTDHDFFVKHVVPKDMITAAHAVHLTLDHDHGCHAGAKGIFTADPGKHVTVSLRVHAGMGHKDGPAQVPTSKINSGPFGGGHIRPKDILT